MVNGFGKLKYQQRSSGGAVDNSNGDRMSAGDAEESVLQRYVFVNLMLISWLVYWLAGWFVG